MKLTERREKLAAMLPDNCIALLFSGVAAWGVGDEQLPFSVDRNFYYFTGCDREHMIYICVKKDGQATHSLAIDPFDEHMAKWVGGRMLPDEARKVSGIQHIMNYDDALGYIHQAISYRFAKEDTIKVYGNLSKQQPSQTTEALKYINNLKELYPHVQACNLAQYCTTLRLVKDEEEIEKLKKALHITDLGIQAMMSHAHEGMSENELEAHFDFVLKTHNCKHSFPSIVAGGKNGTILHYGSNNQPIADNDLVLCDLGASYEYINADITRTFPLSGKFTERQKQIYNIVLEGNRYIRSLVKPGVTLRGLNQKLIEYYEKELKEIGLLENGKQVYDYYWHGVSHMLGLETHDVSFFNEPIQPGNVFTIEPGLYLEDEGIGIRIEDNVLVTEDGCIELSEDIIKTVEEIEAFMASHKA